MAPNGKAGFEMGLNHLSRDANFTKATKIENIFIDKILHKTFINK